MPEGRDTSFTPKETGLVVAFMSTEVCVTLPIMATRELTMAEEALLLDLLDTALEEFHQGVKNG